MSENSNGEFKIEKGVPLIPKGGTRRFVRKYPFPQMETGDSFFVAGDWKKINRTIGSSVSSYNKTHSERFTQRWVTENGVKGIRVWRIADARGTECEPPASHTSVGQIGKEL